MTVPSFGSARRATKLLCGAVLVLLVAAVSGALIVRGPAGLQPFESRIPVEADAPAANGASEAVAPPGTAAAIDRGGITPGTYRYRVERRQDAAAPQVYESTAVVTPTTEEWDHLGTRVRREYLWRGESRVETAMTLLRGDYHGRCDWAPEGLISLRLPVVAKTTWTTRASCRLPVEGGEVSLVVEANALVAEVTEDVVRVDRTTHTRSTVGGKTVERETQRSEWLSSREGLLLRAVERSAEHHGDGRARIVEQSEELLSPTGQ